MLRFSGSISTYSPPSAELYRETLDRSRRSASEALHVQKFCSVSLTLGSLSSSTAEPIIWNESHDLALLWRGELFHDAFDLGGLAARQLTPSQLGIFILQQYENLGLQAFASLNGVFSGIIVDLRTREAVIFTDRYGLNRLYLHEGSDGVFFASEAKFILAARPELRRLELQGVGEWLSCGCTLQNRTLYKGISILPAGSAWIYSPEKPPRRITYFNRAEWFEQAPVSTQQFEQELLATFPRLAKRYFAGYQSKQVAMSLTGGLDGRMVMAWSPAASGQLPCYTFNGPVRDCADVRIARQLASAAGQSHQTIQIGSDFFQQFPTLARECIEISDGAMDVSGASEIYANSLACQIAPVRLTGNYGSETVRANIAFKPGNITAELFASEITTTANAAKFTYDAERNEKFPQPGANARLDFIAFKQVPWHHYARWSVEQSQITVRSPFLDNDLLKLLFRAPSDALPTLEPSLKLIAAGNAALATIPTDRGVTWPAALWKNNALRSYHDFLAKAEYAYDYGMPDNLARLDRSVSFLHLEKLFLGRQKFCHYRSWYRSQLSEFVRDTLLTPTALARPYLNSRGVKSAVEAHLRGTRNITLQIHKLLSLELMHQTLLAPPKDVPPSAV